MNWSPFKTIHFKQVLIVTLLLALSSAASWARGPAEEISVAAVAWLKSLDGEQTSQATFQLDDDERENWHYVPRQRKGLTLEKMSTAQRQLAKNLLAAGLSQRGQLQIESIIGLENILREVEKSTHRNPELYYFSVFGEPATNGVWGWRVEGHHLSINFTLVDSKVSTTPLFFGSNPAEVRIEHPKKGLRIQADEEDFGRALMKSFSEEQRRVALIAAKSPVEIITGNDRQVKPTDLTGISYEAMSPSQQKQFQALLRVYTDRLRPELAALETQKLTARGWNGIHFAWAGGLEKGQGHYYKIQGPEFLIEYDNTQNSANHIHTTWRSFEGDFGRDLLREHHELSHSAKK